MEKGIADADRRIVEDNLKSINESLEKLTTSISKYEQNTLDHDALQELANFKQEKESLEKRAKNIKFQFDNNQSPSASEAESLLNKTKQLLSDINKLRSIVADRRISEADSLTAQYRRESAKALEENMKADSL